MVPYRWILFDADGTLFDFDAAEAQALAEMLREFGIEDRPTLLGEYRQIGELLWGQYERGEITQEFLRVERFRRLFDGARSHVEEMSDRYVHCLGENAQLLDGAAETLHALHGDFRLALVTNGIAAVQNRRLDLSGLRPLFETVVISSDIGHAKPHAGFFDEVFSRIAESRREDVLIVGDNLAVDIRGGANYGIDTCWVNPHGLPRAADIRVDYEVRGIGELSSILR